MGNFFSSYLNELGCVNLETGEFPGPFLTISRQPGCSAQRIAIKLSKILTGYSYMSETNTGTEWKWVDKSVFANVTLAMVDEVKAGAYDDANEVIRSLTALAKAFADDSIYDISDKKQIITLKSIICRLANQGHTIIVGRSAGALLRNIPNKLNIRLEAQKEWRTHRLMQMRDMSWAQAETYINEADKKRDSFIEKVIGRKANNNDFDVIFNYAALEDDYIVDAVINMLKNKKIIACPNDD